MWDKKFIQTRGLETQDQKTLSGEFLIVGLKRGIGKEIINNQNRVKKICKVVAFNEQEILDNLTASEIKIPKQNEVAKWL